MDLLLTDIAQQKYDGDEVGNVVAEWKAVLGDEISSKGELRELVNAPKTWGAVDLPPLIKARIENQITASNRMDSSRRPMQVEEKKLEDDDNWNELTNPQKLRVILVLYTFSNFLCLQK